MNGLGKHLVQYGVTLDPIERSLNGVHVSLPRLWQVAVETHH
jgi:hypothetical protein